MSTQSRLEASLAAHYEVKKEIGAGGMATVFLARDIKHDRDVAIKVLHPDLGAALGAERFLSEIKTTAKLQHPHILPLLDSGEADTLLYYVMPFVAGESLRQRMDREGQLPINEAIRIAREVAGALDYAHRNGVVHRDIKPENILLNDGQALVADFGIALAVSAAGGARMTQTGLSLGTPQYMSPEQAMGERTIDARSDIYALGAVTYEMLTGEPPFTGPNVQAIVSKIMSQRPTPVSAVRDTVPPMTEEAVMTALCKLPADRFATAAQFASALTTGSGNFASNTTAARVGPGRRNVDLIAKRIGIPAIPIALIASGIAFWASTRPALDAPVVRYTISLDSTERITSFVQSPSRAVISPDGSVIVYTGGPTGTLFVRSRSAFTGRSIPNTEGALSPSFSPDGKQIVFSTFASDLKTVSVDGGLVTTVSDSVVGRNGASWGSDGFIYTSRRFARGLIRLRPAPGALPEAATVLDSGANETSHLVPYVLPGGKAFLFMVLQGNRTAGKSMVAVAETGSDKHRLLFEGSLPRYLASGHIVYRATNGAVMAVPFDLKRLKTTGEPAAVSEGADLEFRPIDMSVSDAGTLIFTAGSGASFGRRLVWVTQTGKRSFVDSTWTTGSINFPAISPSGKHAAVSISDASGTHIWIKQLDTGPASKLTTEGRSNSYSSWAPDGRTVSFYSDVFDGELSLAVKPVDGSARLSQIVSAGHPVESAWSPDGKWIVYRTSVSEPGAGDLYAINVAPNSKPVPIAATKEFAEQHPTISPDGKWLAYSSSETGKLEVFVVPFPSAGTAKWQVSSTGGVEPQWSRSGRELFYRDAKGAMTAVSIESGGMFRTGTPRGLFPAFEYTTSPGHRNYDVAADGRFLMVWAPPSPTDQRIYVVDNWFSELRKKFKETSTR